MGLRRVPKPRPVVTLLDVSRSMQAETTPLLHLMRALTVATGAEGFAFGTSLTRLTRVLAAPGPAEAAVAAAGARVADPFGGTRIAASLRDLIASPHEPRLGGAIVVICSDGWDSDAPDRLADAMARLRRRAHRVVWVNPRAGTPGFAPASPPSPRRCPTATTCCRRGNSPTSAGCRPGRGRGSQEPLRRRLRRTHG